MTYTATRYDRNGIPDERAEVEAESLYEAAYSVEDGAYVDESTGPEYMTVWLASGETVIVQEA